MVRIAADLILIDEKKGRRTAKQRGLSVIGLLALLLIAKRAGHISSVGSLINELESRAGFYVSTSVKAAVLKEAGE